MLQSKIFVKLGKDDSEEVNKITRIICNTYIKYKSMLTAKGVKITVTEIDSKIAKKLLEAHVNSFPVMLIFYPNHTTVVTGVKDIIKTIEKMSAPVGRAMSEDSYEQDMKVQMREDDEIPIGGRASNFAEMVAAFNSKRMSRSSEYNGYKNVEKHKGSGYKRQDDDSDDDDRISRSKGDSLREDNTMKSIEQDMSVRKILSSMGNDNGLFPEEKDKNDDAILRRHLELDD